MSNDNKPAAAQEAVPAFYLSEVAWDHIRVPMTPDRGVRAYRHGFDHGDMKLVPFYAAPVAAAPEGFVVVPVEPTDQQVDAGVAQVQATLDALGSGASAETLALVAYDGMIAARPQEASDA